VSYTHGNLHASAVGWLGTFVAHTPEVAIADNATVFLDDESEVQPDAFLFWKRPDASGLHVTVADYLEGTPELVMEIAASSASYDLHDKLEAYRRAGLPEYVVWQIYEARIVWFRLRDGVYERVEPDANGVIESASFPGLRLHVGKMLAGDLAGMLAELARAG